MIKSSASMFARVKSTFAAKKEWKWSVIFGLLALHAVMQLCSYAAMRITTGRARLYNQKWSHANSHKSVSKSLKIFFVLHQGWNFFLLFSFGQEGGCQTILHYVKGYEKLWPFQKYPLPPPPSFCCIHNERSLTSNFFHAILVISFFICFIVF